MKYKIRALNLSPRGKTGNKNLKAQKAPVNKMFLRREARQTAAHGVNRV
jgi:hypothetical protein